MNSNNGLRARLGAAGKAVGTLLLASVLASAASAATSNYAYTTATNASLTDMSTGTTTLVAANLDDAASVVTPIGFDFYFQGVLHTQFSANSNGLIRLGPTRVQTASPYKPLAQAGLPLISAFGADQRTHLTGKVHSRVDGTPPNRVLVVEFQNMQSNFATGGTADLSYQVRLSETSGVIEYVYGAMDMSTAGASDSNSREPHIGFSSSNVIGTVGTVTAPQSGDPAPTYDSASATAFPNLYTAGSIITLSSATDGSRRIFSFAPPVASAPTALNFTATTALSTTLNWTDNASNELGFFIFRSTDGGMSYSLLNQTVADVTNFVDATLSPSATYFYEVRAFTEGTVSAAASNSVTSGAAGSVASTALGGNWSAPATWVGGAVPVSSDNVTIVDGATVTIDTAAVAFGLTIGTGGSPANLIFEAATARSLTLGAGATVGTNGVFTSAATGTVLTHALNVSTDLTNNGTLDFSTSGDLAGAAITFSGASSNTFSGSGATTDIRAITIAKSARENILTVSPTNFSVRGVTTDSAGFLTVTSGTFKLAGSFAGTNRVFGIPAYVIPAAGGFWLDNAAYTITGQTASGTIGGLLRISQGTYNIGTSTGNSLGFSAGSSVIVEGGTINSTGRFGVAGATNAINYAQSAGTITVCTIGNASTTLASFDLGSGAASTINISGGTIITQLAATARDFRNQGGATGITTVTGATLQLGNAASGTAKIFNIAGVVPNLVLTNTSGNHSANFGAPAGFNNISRDITINTGNTLNFGNQVFLFNGTSLVNNGTITHNGAASNFVFFTSTAPILYSGSGVVTAPMSALAVQADQGLTIDPASPNIVANAVRLFSGSVTNSNKLTVGNGAATTATVQIGNTTTPTAAGTFDQPLVFNAGSGGITVSYLRTTASRVTGGEINSVDRTISRITYDDNDPTHTLTINGGDINVTSTATFTNGRVITGANVLNVGLSTVTRTNGYVDGNLRKTFDVVANKSFEVGTANGYSPVVFNVTAGTLPASVTARAVETSAPSFLPVNRALARHWNLTAVDITADLTFNYLDPQDLPVTVTEADLRIYRGVAGVYTDLGGAVDTTLNTATLVGVTTFSDWTLGMPASSNLTITPTLVDFGSVLVGATSATQSVTLSNTGNLSLDISALTSAAAPFALVAGGSCSSTFPITLAAKTSCTLNYTFTPVALGFSSQLFTATTTAPGANTFTLQGNAGGVGALTINPAAVNFGSLNVGVTSSEQTVTLGNTGTAALSISAISVANVPFNRTATGTCSGALPFSIAIGASCTLTYTFTPISGGAAMQSITVTGDGSGNGPFTLNGTGIAVDSIFANGFEDVVR